MAWKRCRPAPTVNSRCGQRVIPISRWASESTRRRRSGHISCLVSNLVFIWQLREAGEETLIDVRVDLPDAEAHRLDGQRASVEHSLHALGTLAAAAVG